MSKKPSLDLAGLVATKGQTPPPSDTLPARSSAPAAAEESATVQPLTFRVPAEFRRRFKTYAAQHDMKLNELLYRAFEDFTSRHP